MLHTRAPISHWPWLEFLWEQAKLSQHEMITSWLRHDRYELSNFLDLWLTPWDSSRFPSPETKRSLQLQRNYPQGYLTCSLIFHSLWSSIERWIISVKELIIQYWKSHIHVFVKWIHLLLTTHTVFYQRPFKMCWVLISKEINPAVIAQPD